MTFRHGVRNPNTSFSLPKYSKQGSRLGDIFYKPMHVHKHTFLNIYPKKLIQLHNITFFYSLHWSPFSACAMSDRQWAEAINKRLRWCVNIGNLHFSYHQTDFSMLENDWPVLRLNLIVHVSFVDFYSFQCPSQWQMITPNHPSKGHFSLDRNQHLPCAVTIITACRYPKCNKYQLQTSPYHIYIDLYSNFMIVQI